MRNYRQTRPVVIPANSGFTALQYMHIRTADILRIQPIVPNTQSSAYRYAKKQERFHITIKIAGKTRVTISNMMKPDQQCTENETAILEQ